MGLSDLLRISAHLEEKKEAKKMAQKETKLVLARIQAEGTGSIRPVELPGLTEFLEDGWEIRFLEVIPAQLWSEVLFVLERDTKPE